MQARRTEAWLLFLFRDHRKADIPPGSKRYSNTGEGDALMLIGIDVGGTTTDAALINGGQVVKTAIGPTDHQDILGCLLRALDKLTSGIDCRKIERVVLSTTLITNLIAEGKQDPVSLVLIPGPGTNPDDYHLPGQPIVLGGAIDYRGREIQSLDQSQVRAAAARIAGQGIKKAAIVGKFCQRNPAHELQAESAFRDAAPQVEVEVGHRVSGMLNFPRRAATTVLTLATRDQYREFAHAVVQAIRNRNIDAPIYILKADGGTLPLDRSEDRPVETIFSGPAASVMGVMALAPAGQTSVVVDIGGTTTDLALILSGQPLLSSKGARVDGMLTHIRAFAVKSLGLGGDSAVRVAKGHLTVGPDRQGPARALGGPLPTPTDALSVLGMAQVGDAALAMKAMQEVGSSLGCSALEASQKVVETSVEKIVREVEQMFLEWEQEPAYRIWEILQKERVRPQNVVGVGGASPALVPMVAERLKARSIVLKHAAVANAIGAAVARPTMTLSLHIDTERGVYSVAEDGSSGEVSGRNLNLQGAEDMARRLLMERARSLGIGEHADEAEVTNSEIFNMVRGWSTVGRLLDVRMEIPAGILPSWGGAGREN